MSFSEESIFQIALTQIPNIGSVQARILVETLGTATNIFRATKKELSAIEGIGSVRADNIKKFSDFTLAEEEILFCQKHHICPLFLTDEAYPKRLANCYDAPTVLYYRGNANLNAPRIISIIGTRNLTDYGKLQTEQIIAELQSIAPLIVSGLAFGIDAVAHKTSVQQQLPTVGVLAHGLDTLYPSQHKNLAKDMLLNGGLLTEFGKNCPPDRHNFPRRNRIVAGIADAVIVVETAAKGGSMITAEIAYSYNKDVFAVPGKLTDSKSAGCLKLIHQQKATIFTSVSQMLDAMGWQLKKTVPKMQRELFVVLTPDEQTIVGILQAKDTVSIDEIYLQSGLSSSSVAAAILSLELQNMIIGLPGKMFRLL